MSRRRALTATGGVGFSAAFLAACGDDDDQPASTGGASTGATGATGSTGASTGGGATGATAASGLVAQPVDTSEQAKQGGTLKWYFDGENRTLDVHVGGSPLNVPVTMVYDVLVRAKPGYLGPLEPGEYLPQFAESWEISPDKTTYTFKLQQDVKWHNKPPVNGRAVDREDVLFSWERFLEGGRRRRDFSNELNPSAPVVSWTMPDDNTLVLELTKPTSNMLDLFTPGHAGLPSILPKETDDTFDIRSDMIGTGPWVADYQPGIGFTFTRHPEYYGTRSGQLKAPVDQPYADQIDVPFIFEYAQLQAQLVAGNVFTAELRAPDILATKSQVPDLQLFQTVPTNTNTGNSLVFGWLPVEENQAFKDDRVRQALSMGLDRDLYIEAFHDVSSFEEEGLPIETYWYSAMGPGGGAAYLDPRDDAFGPNAKYYQFNVEEAKKLMSAAGYGDGLEVISSFVGTGELGTDLPRRVVVREEMWKEIGLTTIPHPLDYASEYPDYREGRGEFEGMAYITGAAPGLSPLTHFFWRFHKSSGAFLGYDVNNTGDGSGDPNIDPMIEKAQAEFDTEVQKEIFHELQRYIAGKAYIVPLPGTASGFQPAWPALGNFMVYQGDRRGEPFTWWVDDSKAPLA